MTKGRNIGKGLTILAHHELNEAHLQADVDAWGAPSECHDDVRRGEALRFRAVRRHVRAVTGLKWRAFRNEVQRRTNGKVLHLAEQGALLPMTEKLADRYPML